MKRTDNSTCIFKYLFFLSVVSVLAILVFGCKKQIQSPVIARVGKAILTLDDLYKSIPPEYAGKISRDQNINYVKQWIDTELLFQEAMRRKIDREPAIRQRLEKMKKDLLSSEMLSRNSIAENSMSVNDQAVHDYYQEHRGRFVRERDMIRYIDIVVDNGEEARQIKNSADGANFASLAMTHSKVPVPDTGNIPYIPVDDIPLSIRRPIASTSIPGITSPVKDETGYHVIRVIDRLNKGELCSEDEVKDEIINVLSTKAQKEEVERLLSELRLKTNVEFHFDVIPGRTENPAKNAEVAGYNETSGSLDSLTESAE